jgi:hypothetical protein
MKPAEVPCVAGARQSIWIVKPACLQDASDPALQVNRCSLGGCARHFDRIPLGGSDR